MLKQGDTVVLRCYEPGCEGERIAVSLGNPEQVPLPANSIAKGGFGRHHWDIDRHTLTAFSLTESEGGSGIVRCPGCGVPFSSAIVITGRHGAIGIFGYSPNPY